MLITSKRETEKWHQINFRNVESVLGAEFIFDLYDQYVSEINIFRYRNVNVFYSNNEVFSYTPQKDWEYINRKICKRFLNLDEDLADTISHYATRKKDKLFSLWEKIDRTDLGRISNEDLGDLLLQWYYVTLNDIFKLNLAPVEHGITEAIRTLLVRMDSGNVDEDISTLLSFSKKTVAVQEEYDLLRMCLKEESISEDEEKLVKHWEKYRSLRCAYGTSPWDIGYFYKRAKAIQSKGKDYIEKRILGILEYPERIAGKRDECLKKYNNTLLKSLSKLGCMIGELRDNNKALLGKSILYRNRIVSAICERYKMKDSDVKYYFLAEMVALATEGRKVGEEELKSREQGLMFETGLKAETGVASKAFLHTNILDSDSAAPKRLIGTCASKGEAVGKVKICISSDQCKNVEDGDILVAYGTDFDFIEAMEKAAGIITEEGGMLSHASVISRETGKPCVIGVHNAVRYLKDGDVVEINAEKGEIVLIDHINTYKRVKHSPYIYRWKEIKEGMLREVGAKAYNLATIGGLNYPIMDGIVLGTNFFYECIKKQDLWEDYLKANAAVINGDTAKIEKVIRAINLEGYDFFIEANEFYAVRSSGGQEDGINDSFAGQHHTALFCKGYEEIINGIKDVWISFFSSGAMVYRKNKKLSLQDMAGAVIIQKMLNPEYSGVAFSNNPITHKSEVVIESCKGHCFQIVDGITSPSRYFVNPLDKKVTYCEEHNQVYLEEKLISKIADIALKLEEISKTGVDIEWGSAGETVFVMQMRPITT